MKLTIGAHLFDLARQIAVMAVVNRTTDSLVDGDATLDLDAALDLARNHAQAGADLIDIGAVSAGPGPEVSVEEERERVVSFVEAFRARSDLPLSVDTFRSSVAADALDAGAELVNDPSGMSDPAIADAVAARQGAGLVVTHAGGPPRTRSFRPVYEPDVTTVVTRTCRDLAADAQRRGVPADRLVVDPGIDLGKNTMHSLELVRRLPELAALGFPVLVALSRKDFLGEVLDAPVTQRGAASLAGAVTAALGGANLVRVHDTLETVRALRTVEAIQGWRRPARCVRGLE